MASILFGLIAVLASGEYLAVVVDDIGTTAAAAIAAIACLVASHRAPLRRTRRGWLFVGLACLSWSAGNAMWAWYELVLDQEAPFPSPADVGYLGFVPLVVVGVAYLGPSFASIGTWKRVLDVTLITVSVAGTGWIVVLSPVAESTDGLGQRALSLAYPMGDIVVVALILSMIVVTRERNRSLALLLGGLILFAAADVAFAYTTATGAYASGSLIVWAWFTGFLAMALAARPAAAAANVDLLRAQWVAEVVTHLPVLAVGALLVGQQWADGEISAATVVLVLVVGALNAARHLAASRHNATLTQVLGEQVAALEEEQERTHRVIDEARDPYVELDRDGRVLVWNGPCEEVFGWTIDQMRGRLISDIVPAENRQVSKDRIARFVETGDPDVWEEGTDVRYLRPDGTEVPIAIAAWHTGSGDAFRIHSFVWDISERLAEQELTEASERKWRALVRHSSDMTLVLDRDGHLAEEVPTTRLLLGYGEGETEGRHIAELIHPEDLVRVLDRFAWVMDGPGDQERARFRILRFDGTWAHVEAIATNLLDEPAVGGIVCNLRDVTEQVAAENELRRQARRDPLTGLPNRNRLTAALARQCEERGRGTRRPAPHGPGPVQGRQRRPRPRRRRPAPGRDRPPTRPCHPRQRRGRPARRRRVRRAPDPPDGPPSRRDRGREPRRDDPRADSAGRREPGGRGEHRHRRVRPGRRPLGHAPAGRRGHVPGQAPRRRVRGLRQHGRRGAPQHREGGSPSSARASTGTASSCTTSPRWSWPPAWSIPSRRSCAGSTPARGLLPPDEFIPLAEGTGLIRDLTVLVLETSLRQCATWRAEGLDLSVAVNLSPRVLSQADVVSWVRRALEAAEVPASRLTLEITESAFPENTRGLTKILDRLGQLGVRLAVDDFGTGWSSLSKLKELPVQELKIDRSFVFALAEDDTDHSIVRSIIDLARSLNLSVVAEGVETEEVAHLLRDLGCPLAQGYLYSRPVTGPALTGWVLEREARRIEERRRAREAHPSTQDPT